MVFGNLCSTYVDMIVIKFIIASSIDFLEAEVSQPHILVSHSYIFTLLERGGNCNILFKFSSTLVIYIILATAVSLIILVFSACLCCNNLSDQLIKFALRKADFRWYNKFNKLDSMIDIHEDAYAHWTVKEMSCIMVLTRLRKPLTSRRLLRQLTRNSNSITSL